MCVNGCGMMIVYMIVASLSVMIVCLWKKNKKAETPVIAGDLGIYLIIFIIKN